MSHSNFLSQAFLRASDIVIKACLIFAESNFSIALLYDESETSSMLSSFFTHSTIEYGSITRLVASLLSDLYFSAFAFSFSILACSFSALALSTTFHISKQDSNFELFFLDCFLTQVLLGNG